MPDDVVLSPEAAAAADAIRSLDQQLDALEAHERRLIEQGVKGGLISPLLAAERRDDAQREALLRRRAELVARLKALTGVE